MQNMHVPDAETLLAHAGFLRGLARSLLFDDTRVDDVVQQAWLAALERPPRDPGRLRPWLATVVRNFARRARRDEGRRSRRERAMPPRESLPSAEEILERENARRSVVLAVLELEEPYRSTVVLRYLDELPPREVARRMGVPVETVRTRVKRGLARLREKMDTAYGGNRRAWALALVPFALPKASAATAGVASGALLMLGAKTKIAILCLLLLGLLALLAPAVRDSRSHERTRAVREAARAVAAAPREDAEETRDEPAPPPAGTTLLVQVTAEGTPVPGAIVFVERGDTLLDMKHPTDARGCVAFSATGPVTLRAAHPDYSPGTSEAEAVEGRVTEARVQLTQAAWVDVEVVGAETGGAVRDAEVLVLRSGEKGRTSTGRSSSRRWMRTPSSAWCSASRPTTTCPASSTSSRARRSSSSRRSARARTAAFG